MIVYELSGRAAACAMFHQMELRDFARIVLESEDLAVKLAPPAGALTHELPGPAFRASGRGRPPGLRTA